MELNYDFHYLVNLTKAHKPQATTFYLERPPGSSLLVWNVLLADLPLVSFWNIWAPFRLDISQRERKERGGLEKKSKGSGMGQGWSNLPVLQGLQDWRRDFWIPAMCRHSTAWEYSSETKGRAVGIPRGWNKPKSDRREWSRCQGSLTSRSLRTFLWSHISVEGHTFQIWVAL